MPTQIKQKVAAFIAAFILAPPISSVPSKPGDIQCLLDFGLDGAQQVGPHLLQQLCEQDEEPVLQVFPVQHDEVHQRLQEHAEHLRGQRTAIIPSTVFHVTERLAAVSRHLLSDVSPQRTGQHATGKTHG